MSEYIEVERPFLHTPPNRDYRERKEWLRQRGAEMAL